jgi:DNA-binding response OmpR family regulator
MIGLPPAPCDGSAAAPPTVLVVEDDPVVMQTCVILLEDHGFRVVTAINGVDGLKQFRTHKPQLVLTDIVMPEKEGVGLIMELRREDKDVKIIAMSGSGRMGNTDYVTIAAALGANVGLYKPFDDLELIGAVRTLLGQAAEPDARASAA